MRPWLRLIAPGVAACLLVLGPPPADAACIIKHVFVSAKPEGGDPTVIRPSNWNDCHSYSGGTNGQFVVVDTSDATYRTGFTTGLTFPATGGTLANAQGTLTTDLPAWSSTATWNAGAVTFTHWKANVTDTASAAGSLLLDLQVGGVSKFKVQKDGNIQLSTDVILARDAGNILAQRNGTNPQTLRVYGTFTDAANFERLEIVTQVGSTLLQQTQGGTGTARELIFGTVGAAAIRLRTTNTNRWAIDASPGHLTPGTDNTQDVGSASLRPRDLYLGTSVRIGTNPATTGAVRLANNTIIQSRNFDNTANRDLAFLGTTSEAVGAVYGDVAAASRIRSSLVTPASLGNGDWWVECTGTSPSRVCAIKVQDGGATRTIASVTY